MNIPNNLCPLGTKGKLPPGYTRLEFLESAGQQGIQLQYAFDCNTGIEVVGRIESTNATGIVVCIVLPNTRRVSCLYFRSDKNTHSTEEYGTAYGGTGVTIANLGKKSISRYNWLNDKTLYIDNGETSKSVYSEKYVGSYTSKIIGVLCWVNRAYYMGTVYSVKVSQLDKEVVNLIPALDPTGEPCMFDLVSKQAFKNIGTGQFIAGVGTVAQLTTLLRRLPATGGELTLSLPAEANTPEVAEALQACHDTKGWTLTVHEYRPAEAAVATYSLRRVREVIWCRKVQAEYGSYVDSTGTRWQVEWCAAIFGAQGQDPTAYGYEPFDSVDAATAYWEITPYIEPEEQTVSTAEL